MIFLNKQGLENTVFLSPAKFILNALIYKTDALWLGFIFSNRNKGIGYMNKIKAFIFDLNGTIIDDMKYHEKAWTYILNNKLQAGLTSEEVKEQMYGKNSEVLARIFGPDKFSDKEVKELEMEKERSYQKAFLPELKSINGFEKFIQKAKKSNIKMGIGSAAIPFNIDFVLDGLNIREYFSAVISADDVDVSKPHPETFLKAATLLNVKPEECIVFEDAPKGVEAALNAKMKSIVLTTMHPEEHFKIYDNILFFIDDYTDKKLDQLVSFFNLANDMHYS